MAVAPAGSLIHWLEMPLASDSLANVSGFETGKAFRITCTIGSGKIWSVIAS